MHIFIYMNSIFIFEIIKIIRQKYRSDSDIPLGVQALSGTLHHLRIKFKLSDTFQALRCRTSGVRHPPTSAQEPGG